MNFFKNYTFTWWQIGLLKVSVACIGVVIGAQWPEVFARYTMALIVIAVVLGIYLAVISCKK